MINPIKDNRIVNDITFAIRFRDFVKDIQVSDACGEEEQKYLLGVAKDLLKYQIETCKSGGFEYKYLKNIEDLI